MSSDENYRLLFAKVKLTKLKFDSILKNIKASRENDVLPLIEELIDVSRERESYKSEEKIRLGFKKADQAKQYLTSLRRMCYACLGCQNPYHPDGKHKIFSRKELEDVETAVRNKVKERNVKSLMKKNENDFEGISRAIYTLLLLDSLRGYLDSLINQHYMKIDLHNCLKFQTSSQQPVEIPVVDKK